MKIWKTNSIFSQILLSFLAVSLIPLSIQTWLNYRLTKETLKKQVIAQLGSVADRQGSQIEAYALELKRQVDFFTASQEIVMAVRNCEETLKNHGPFSPEYQAHEKSFHASHIKFLKVFGYLEFYLITKSGKIVFSAGDKKNLGSNLYAGQLRNSGLTAVFDESIVSKKTQMSNFERLRPNQTSSAFISSPILEDGEIAGAAVFELNDDKFYKIVSNYAGLGKTGEIVLGAKIGPDVTFMLPLRFDSQAAMKKTYEMGIAPSTIPIQLAAQGEDGQGASIDYRGRKILAVWKYLPVMDWGMVVKIDQEEAFAPIQDIKRLTLISGIFTFFAVTGLAVLLARYMSGPINRLSRKIGLISEGDLNQKADESPNNEIGQLANSFNKMVDQLNQSYAKLHRVNKEITRSNKELAEFAYVVSHDLKEPLRGIYNYSNFLLQDYGAKLDKDGRGKLETIIRLSMRQEKLIDEILNFSRIGQSEMAMVLTDLNLVIHDVVASLKPELEKNNIKVNKIPRFPKVVCDKVRVGKIFRNLITNAMKYNDKEKKWVEIGFTNREKIKSFSMLPTPETGSGEQESQTVYYVRDNGIGIQPQYHEDIFGIFKRLHGRKEYGGGTGAGLTIVKKIVERHNGSIWLRSIPKQGTTFYFTLDEEE